MHFCVSIYFCLKRHHIPFINSHNYCTAVFVSFVCGVNICGFILVIFWYFCFFFLLILWFDTCFCLSVTAYARKKWKQHSIRSINFKTVIICQQKFSTINQRWESIVFQINFIPKSNQFYYRKMQLVRPYSSLQAIHFRKWALRQKNVLFARKWDLRQKTSSSLKNELFVRKRARKRALRQKMSSNVKELNRLVKIRRFNNSYELNSTILNKTLIVCLKMSSNRLWI